MIKSPSDMDGLKFRVTPSKVERAVIQDWGAAPTVLGISEVYTALQTGTVDGLAIPPITSTAFALHEVGKYFIDLNFQPHGSFIVINNDLWNSFSPDIQKKVQDAADKAVFETIALYNNALSEAFEVLESADVTVYRPNPSEFEQFKKSALKNAESIATDGFSKEELDFYKTVQEETKKFR